MLASFVDLSLLKTINLLNLWLHVTPRSLRRLRASQRLIKKGYMNRQKILIEHWRWLQVNGYKQQAASCKHQAASLTRKQYRIIREYESKRSKKNN